VTDEFVHDVQWNPNGSEFALAYGAMPFPKVSLFDLKSNKTADIERVEARNKLYYDRHGRILCVGGFGSLNGDMDFWDLTSPELRKVGHANAFSSSFQQWCPNSYHFLTGIVSPRVKVDNGVKIFTYQGALVYEECFTELYKVEWSPCPKTGFPPKEIVRGTISPVAKTEIYRHKNFTGRSAAPVTKVNTAVRYAPGGAPVGGIPGGTPVVGGGGRGRVPVGGTPVGGTPVRQPKKKPNPGPKGPQAQGKPPNQQNPAQGGTETKPQDPEKRKKQIELKLQQIGVLKQKQTAGQPLDAAQLVKIGTETSLREELAGIVGLSV